MPGIRTIEEGQGLTLPGMPLGKGYLEEESQLSTAKLATGEEYFRGQLRPATNKGIVLLGLLSIL